MTQPTDWNARKMMTDDQIKHMVQRFLMWKLPETFSPDNGVSFEPEFNKEWNAKQGKPPQRHEPSGTNLLDATQAEAMVRHLVEGLPSADYRPDCQKCGEPWAVHRRDGQDLRCRSGSFFYTRPR